MEELLSKVELNFENHSYTEEKKRKKSPTIWALILIALISLISILFKVIFTNQYKKIKDILTFAESSVIGEINCSYDIKSITQNTKLIGNEFTKDSLFDLYIDGKKVQYSKEYKFTSLGKHKVQIKLYQSLNMNYMFKDVKDLISVEMNSENNCIIDSMISTFENCNKLVDFNISGFNIERVRSMSKMFYNTSLSTFSPSSFNSKSLQDMSYMFAYSSVEKISFNNFNSIRVKNMSNLFRNCTNLRDLNLYMLDTNEVNDMSYMFSNLEKLYYLSVITLKTSKVTNMSHMFQGCHLGELDLQFFNTKSVIDMFFMFSNSRSLRSLDLSIFLHLMFLICHRCLEDVKI